MARKTFNDRYRAETTRLRGYDYASAGWYHVVICTKDRVCHFGEVRSGVVGLSKVGCAAHRFCREIPDHTDRAVVDAFIVMPNHVHAIIGLVPRTDDRDDIDGRRDARSRVSTKTTTNEFGPLQPGSLSSIVHGYKAAVTRWARKHGYDTFAWQPRFYDRIIRNERELHATRRYVNENPLKWHLDRNHPHASS